MKRAYDTTGINLGGGFEPVPEGVYTLIIREVADIKDGQPWKTKNGDDYVRVTCEIDDVGEYLGKKVWYGVTIMDDKKRPGAGMAVHFLKTIGEPWDGPVQIDTDNWIGKTFKAKLKIIKDNQGKSKNEIAFILNQDEADVPF